MNSVESFGSSKQRSRFASGEVSEMSTLMSEKSMIAIALSDLLIYSYSAELQYAERMCTPTVIAEGMRGPRRERHHLISAGHFVCVDIDCIWRLFL